MLNRVILTGRLVRDPELRKVGKNATSICSFTLAVDDWMKGPDGNLTTSFFNCVVWGQAGENTAKYARKGLLVGVDGRLVQRSYDRKDGSQASIVEVNCESVQFLEPKHSDQPLEEKPQDLETKPVITRDDITIDDFDSPVNDPLADDDLPF